MAISKKLPLSFISELSQLKRFVISFPLWQPRFNPRSGYAVFMVNKVTLG
jgi:hypothetical protein